MGRGFFGCDPTELAYVVCRTGRDGGSCIVRWTRLGLARNKKSFVLYQDYLKVFCCTFQLILGCGGDSKGGWELLGGHKKVSEF